MEHRRLRVGALLPMAPRRESWHWGFWVTGLGPIAWGLSEDSLFLLLELVVCGALEDEKFIGPK